MQGTYTVQVNSKWNDVFRKAAPLAFASIAVFGIGCGGLGASGSVSPASFLLPGIGHHEPQNRPSREHDPAQQSESVASIGSSQVLALSPDLVQ